MSQDVKPTKRIRSIHIVLVASLALNLAVAGALVGAAIRHEDEPQGGDVRVRAMQSRDFGLGPYVGALEHDQRRELGRSFVRTAGDPQQERDRVAAQFEDIVETLSADTFDEVAFENLVRGQQIRLAEQQEVGVSLLVDYVSGLSPEARKAYAERLDQILKRPRPKPRDKDFRRD